MAGWIKLHRSISDHWVWDCEFSYGQAWIDLLTHACHKPNKLTIKGQLISLEIGEQARSEVTLSKTWKWSRNKVRRFLKNLESDGMIEQKTTHLTSIISICNYSSFQGGETTDGTPKGQQKDNRKTAKGQQAEHKQECKELKEWKENKFVEFWSTYKKSSDKQKCFDKFMKLTEEDINKIISVLPSYVRSTPDVKFRKNPLTWINGKCWNDVVGDYSQSGESDKPDWMRGML